MNLVEWLQHLMTNFGAAWVMWLMIALSVASVTIMLERGWFYYSIRDDIPTLAQSCQHLTRARTRQVSARLESARIRRPRRGHRAGAAARA